MPRRHDVSAGEAGDLEDARDLPDEALASSLRLGPAQQQIMIPLVQRREFGASVGGSCAPFCAIAMDRRLQPHVAAVHGAPLAP